MGNSPLRPRWILIASLLTILAIATGLRVYRLPELPLGLHYDEATNGILAGEIAQGLRQPIFIPSYTGKEVLFFYWSALLMRVLGITPLALRLAAALVGVLTVVAATWTAYELFHDVPDGPWIALFSAATLAISFWHIVLSRYGFRAITQPVLQAITVAALWRGLRPAPDGEHGTTQRVWLIVAGLLCGLTAYTYLAARAFPVPLAAALVTLIVADRHRRQERLKQSAMVLGAAALALVPLAHYWLTHPGSFTTRARQVAADNWVEAREGILACLRMFFLRGDPYVRFNLPGRPLFDPVLAGLFLLGLGIMIRRLVGPLPRIEGRRRPLSLAATVFLLTSLAVMILPSALATDEITPSNLRSVGLLPFIYTFPALGLWATARFIHRFVGSGRRLASYVFAGVCFVLLAIGTADVAPDYVAWASSPTLYYVADGDLAEAADYLNRADLAVSTPYVASQHYRHPTLAFLAEDYDTVRWLVDGQTLVFPPDGDALLIFPRSASNHLDWVRSMLPKEALIQAAPGPDGASAFHVYRGEMADAPSPSRQHTANFGDVARLLGYSVINQPRSGQRVDVAVWWKVTEAADQPDYRPVARLTDRWGSTWGETDAPHYPSEQWREDELIVDYLSIPISPGAPPGGYVVRLGLYSPGADARLPLLDDGKAYAGLYAELPVQVARASAHVVVDEIGIDHRLDAAVDGLTLLGTSIDRPTVRPGERLRITLFWQAGDATSPPVRLSLQLGETTLHSGHPVHDTYPFSMWDPGEVVVDRYHPRLPLDTSPGTYKLKLRVGEESTLDLGKVTVQDTDRQFEIPPIAHPLTTMLGHRVELLGYSVSSESVTPGETLVLTLTWRALTQMTADYTVFTHLLAPDGSMAGQQDRQPVGGDYPTSLWAPGEVVTDVYNIAVDATAGPGEYRLEVGMYLVTSGARLSVEGSDDNAVSLRKITVTE